MSKNTKLFILITGIVGLLFVFFGVTYAFFGYMRVGGTNTLVVGRVSFNHTQSSTITLTNIYPIKASQITTKPDYVGTSVITITGDTEYGEGIEYLLSIYDAHITVNNKKIPVSLDISASNIGYSDSGYFNNRGDDDLIYKVISNGEVDEGNRLLVGYIPGGSTGVNGSVTIKAFIDVDKMVVTDTVAGGNVNVTGYNNLVEDDEINGKEVFTVSEWNSVVSTPISFKIKVDAQEGVWVEDIRGYVKVRKAITAKVNAETNSCNPIWVDNMDTANDTSDDITYFSGTNECVDMNYVWYSGKLWRITAIYPDGTMKLITQNNMTSISFSPETLVDFYIDENNKSYMYQWLNEDFYDTLYHAKRFIDTTKMWNATAISSTARPAETTMVSSNVGLLIVYEYYNSYQNDGVTDTTSYLANGYSWWLLNRSGSTTLIKIILYDGTLSSTQSKYYAAVRPAIMIKNSVEFTGNGTIDNPYRIVGDKETGKPNDLINTRLSGEYVKLLNGANEELFRIVNTEDGKTKIIAIDYADNKALKQYADSSSTGTIWGSAGTMAAGTWYTYFNDTYLPALVTANGNLFDSGTYYLGTTKTNYKLSVCAGETYESIKTCPKTSVQGTFNIGLPRYGEMFATQQAGGDADSINMRLINNYSSTYIWYVRSNSSVNGNVPTETSGARPTLHLKSTVKILSGSGTESNPYVVGL